MLSLFTTLLRAPFSVGERNRQFDVEQLEWRAPASPPRRIND